MLERTEFVAYLDEERKSWKEEDEQLSREWHLAKNEGRLMSFPATLSEGKVELALRWIEMMEALNSGGLEAFALAYKPMYRAKLAVQELGKSENAGHDAQ